MKVKRSLFWLVVFASVVLAAGPVMAAITNVAITAPTATAKAYIRTNGDEAARTVNVDYTFTANKTNQDIRWDAYIAPGTAYAVYVRDTMPQPISLTPYYETKTLAAMATTPEGLYDVRVRVSQPQLGNWTAFESEPVEVVKRTEVGAVMVDNTAPTSAIASPANGASLIVSVPVTIIGTASDPVSGGVASGVAAVAVSVSDGITTTPLTVTGTDSWSAPWTPTAVGTYTITSVATDRSGNVQSPGTSITVYVVAPTSEGYWEGETAWAAGARYVVDQGNWATYTPYAEGSVDLFAGQTLDAGTVAFSAVVGGNVTITITLDSGWRFKDVAENVKIQDYATAPSGNPSPGSFAHKGNANVGESVFQISVPANNYYGVHVNAERWVSAP